MLRGLIMLRIRDMFPGSSRDPCPNTCTASGLASPHCQVPASAGSWWRAVRLSGERTFFAQSRLAGMMVQRGQGCRPTGQLLWLLILAAASFGTAQGQVSYKRINGNLQGDVLVLSVNRAPLSDGKFTAQGSGLTTLIQSAQDCEDQCTFVSGCQGWTYCSRAGGCGGGCQAYHAKQGPGYQGNAHGCTPVGTIMPIPYDSTYGPGNRLADWKNPPGVCTGDAWPQHTCTLKTNVTTPKIYTGNQVGWISGTVTLAAKCAPPKGVGPMTAFECSTCLQSADPAGCIACSNKLYTSPNICGFNRKAYWARTKAGNIDSLRHQTCAACACYNKPSDTAARNNCYEVTQGIGVYQSKYGTTWYKVLDQAAAKCPKS